MRKISYTNRFLKDYKQIKKRGWDIQQLEMFIDMLATNQPLPPSTRPHKLSGKYRHAWDAHVSPDWILIYELDNNHLILRRTGTHADLF